MPHNFAAFLIDGTPAGTASLLGLTGGTESAVIVREYWNDRNAAFPGTTTALHVVLKMLAASSGGAFKSSGLPPLDELWSRVTVLGYVRTEDAGETVIFTTDGATGTLPIGTNSEIPLRDIAPQEGVRLSFSLIAPGGADADAFELKPRLVANQASSPTGPLASLGTGGGIIPADRIPSLRMLLSGSIVTADDTDTIAISGGQHVYDGTISQRLDEAIAFDLLDSAAVAIGAGESYRVTISRDADGDLVVTKGLQNVVASYPSLPAGNVFVANLTVASADGIAVTVSQASVIQSAVRYAALHARAGAGLTLILSFGQAVSSTDIRQFVSHEVQLEMTAASTNRVWLLPDGNPDATVTEVPPQIGANLIYLVTTDGATITDIQDARVLLHRALVLQPLEFPPYTDAFSQLPVPAFVSLLIAHEDFEIERLSMDLTDVDGTWSVGDIVADVMLFGPGVAVPFPFAEGGTSIFTGYLEADLPLRLAFDATTLRVETDAHTVRRIAKGSRLMLVIRAKPTAPAAEMEQQLRVALHVRRYR